MQQTVYVLAPSPAFAVDGVIFAAGGEGLYRSDDHGATWRPAQASLQLPEPLPATALALSPDFATDRRMFSGAPGAVLRTADGGNTWLVTPLASPPPTVSSLIVSPDFARDGVVLAGTVEDGIFRSEDRGGRWQPWNFGLLDFHVLALAVSPAFAEDETVFAATDSGIFRSTNAGRAWRELDFSPDFAPVLSLAVSPAFSTDETVFAGTEAHGLFRSCDGGVTWTRAGGDALPETVNGIIPAQAYPEEPHLLVVGDRLHLSRDDGATWSTFGDELGDADVISCAAPFGLAPGASLLVGPHSGGVTRVSIPR